MLMTATTSTSPSQPTHPSRSPVWIVVMGELSTHSRHRSSTYGSLPTSVGEQGMLFISETFGEIQLIYNSLYQERSKSPSWKPLNSLEKLHYVFNIFKTKRRRSDPVLWQKPLHQQKCQKGKVTTQTTPQKSSIKQQLRSDLGRSVGVTAATKLVWWTWFQLLKPLCLAKDHWWEFITRKAHLVHIVN